jgi:DNA-binding CsgD family transcriptional regulator
MADTRAVFRVLGDVRDLRADRAAWQRHAIESLAPMLGAAQGTCLWLEHFRPGGALKVRELLHAGWSNPANAAMWEEALDSGNFAADPQMVPAMRIADPVVAVLRPQLVPDDQWYSAPLVPDWLRVTETDGHASGWFRMDGARDEALVFAFHRYWRDRPATERQRNVLRLFVEELSLLWREGRLAMTAAVRLPELSPRERQVLDRLAAGDSVRQAALFLGLSHRTVEDHVKSLHRKFGVKRRGELLARYLGPVQ